MTLLKILLGITLSIWLWFIYATIHYDNISPTVADESSGHIYPSYDKFHGRYVYLDRTAKNYELEIALAAGALFLCSALVILKVKGFSTKPRQ
jgi:hypothetical protein